MRRAQKLKNIRRLREAHNRVIEVESKLKESQNASKDLQKSFDELRSEFFSIEFHVQHLSKLERRVDELNKELTRSERQLIVIRHKLSKCQSNN